MTSIEDRRLPEALAEVGAVLSRVGGGGGIDFEPFPEFLSGAQTTEWIRAWTGNATLSGDDFRVFGQDGSGGYAAFWLVRNGRPLDDQPVVFLGSEGETGVVARDLGDFLWLLAGGLGPLEAAEPYTAERVGVPNPDLTATAERFAPDRHRLPAEIVLLAAEEFPHFTATIDGLCRFD
ncbi:hypothetical protein [Actinomadura flavalba]|uniref:hypothetical protein n=1 Tax=Actinomadura flavalba TaxID=1120938 RepID=UPI000526FEB1|nr:hypothetical protein [Actinomadura flavalba]